MEDTGIKSKKEEIQKELNEIIPKIVEVLQVERIYLNKGVGCHSYKNRLNIITKLNLKENTEHIIQVVNGVFLNIEDFSYRVFTFAHALSELQQGNLYFLNNCQDKDLVYKAPETESLWKYPSEKPTKLYETIKRDFKRDMARMKSFKKGAYYFKTQKSLSQSAFMMHQTFEQGYRILERFICGKIKICHSIKNHQTFVLKTLSKFEGIFQIESDSDSKLLDLLEDAYSSARYSHTYQISKNELNQLSEKLGLFINEIKFLFNRELSVFNEFVIRDKIDLNSEQPLELLNSHKESDSLVRKLEFDSSFEMLCMAKSLMILSMTCLQDDVDPPMHVYGFDYSINEVLQLAIKILPLEETSP